MFFSITRALAIAGISIHFMATELYYVAVVGGGNYLEQSLTLLEMKRIELKELEEEFNNEKISGEKSGYSEYFF